MAFLILLLAVFFRLTNLGGLPYMFDGDETYFGYYSYTLANFGTDEYGNKLPVYFSSIGDYKYPVYAYLGTVWIKIFGLSPTTTRLTSAIAGLIAIPLIAILAALFTHRKKFAFYASYFLAFSPWHIWMSRRALEANLGFTLILLTVITLLKKWWGLTVLFAVLAMFTYPSSRIFILELSVLGMGYFLLQKKRAEILTCSLILLIGIFSFLSPQSRARGSDITVWNTGNLEKIQQQVDLDIHADGVAGKNIPVILSRLLHNQYFYLAKDVVDKALSHFDPTYLFVTGETRDRYSIPRMGLLTYAEGIAIITGLFALYKKNRKLWFIALSWWILSAISPAITTEPVHSVRFAIALAATSFIGGYGIFSLPFRYRLAFFLALSLNFGYFWHQYSIQKTYRQPWYLEAEMRRLPELVAKYETNYSAVSVPGDVYIYFLFRNRVAPSDFLSRADIDPVKFGWDRVNKYGKIEFKMSSPCPKIGKLKTLYVCVGSDIPLNARVIDLVRYPDDVPAYSLIEFFPISQVTGEPLPDRLHRMVESDFRFNPDGLLPNDYPGLWL